MSIYTILLYILVSLAGISLVKYVIYLISAPFYYVKRARLLKPSKALTQEQIEQQLPVSVVVPAWNEEVGIQNTLKSLYLNTYNNMEIIVVSDGSTDNTAQKVYEFKDKILPTLTTDKTHKRITFYEKENGGKGSALNYGIKRSRGKIIITVDADTVFEKDAIYKIVRYFINPEVDAGVGNVKVANNRTLIGFLQQLEYTMGFYFKRTHAVLIANT